MAGRVRADTLLGAGRRSDDPLPDVEMPHYGRRTAGGDRLPQSYAAGAHQLPQSPLRLGRICLSWSP